MNKGLLTVVAVLGFFVLMALLGGSCLVGRYNTMVEQQEKIDGQWAQVENVLQRRADLIPNLVNTVKGFADHEKEVFTNIADARSKLLGAEGPKAKAEANTGLNSALGRLMAISERYPELKSNQSFTRLQDELAGTENRISVERKRYNEAVRAFNTSIKKFPNSFLAGTFGFDSKEYFEAEEGAKEAPEVNFE